MSNNQHMAKKFFERVKSFIVKPKKAFDEEKKTSLKDTILYGFKGFILFAIPYSIIAAITGWYSGGTLGLVIVPIILIFVPFVGIAGTIIGALWYHLWAYVFGAREGWENTARALFFGNTPTYILGWIPIVNIAIGIWSLVLFGMGLKRLQKLSTGRTIAAILVAMLIPLLIIGAIVAWAVITYGPLLESLNDTTSTFSVPY